MTQTASSLESTDAKADEIARYEDPEGIDQDSAPENWAEYPIDSVLIRSEPRTVFEVVRRIKANQYVMDPDFQRDFIWDDKKQSGLIESCLMRIPLPVFYLAEQSDGKVVVVDGLQRLGTFHRFLSDQLVLRLPERPDLDGKKFSALAPKLQNRVEDTNLIFYLIDPKVPERAKLDIFERVNSGVPLTRQQMRNCIHAGPATRWLKDASVTEEFLTATGRSLNPKSMRDREVISRFCGFYLLGLERYRGDMDDFLSDTLKHMNRLPSAELDELSTILKRSMVNNHAVFGRHAFRKHLPDSTTRNPINIALFDVYSTLLAPCELSVVEAVAERLRQGFFTLMDAREFIDAISLGTNQVDRVRTRFRHVRAQIEGVFRDA